MIRVYHQMLSINGPHFEFVAEVKGDDLDRAYALTNHIDNDWALNADVNAMPGNHRSTSVGDLLLLCTPGGTHGECHVVGPCGFRHARTKPESHAALGMLFAALIIVPNLLTHVLRFGVSAIHWTSTSLHSVVARHRKS